MEEIRIPRWSGLSRSIDLRLGPHRWLLGLSALAGVVGVAEAWVAVGQPTVPGLVRGVGVAAAALLAWVLGRELDPDAPHAAFLGLSFAVPGALALGPPNLLLGYWMVALLRSINRTTGLPARPLDDLMLVAVSLWLAGRFHAALLAATAVALLLDSWLRPGHSRHRWLAVALLVAGLGWTWVRPGDALSWPGWLPLWPLGLGGLLFGLVALTLPPSSSVGDFTNVPLRPQRVRAGRWSALTMAYLTLLLAPPEGLRLGLPLWAAILGISGYHLAASATGRIGSEGGAGHSGGQGPAGADPAGGRGGKRE